VRHRDSTTQLEKTNISLQKALDDKKENEEKIARLSSEKKVLVKEFKALRKKLDETTKQLDESKSVITEKMTIIDQLRKDTEKYEEEKVEANALIQKLKSNTDSGDDTKESDKIDNIKDDLDLKMTSSTGTDIDKNVIKTKDRMDTRDINTIDSSTSPSSSAPLRRTSILEKVGSLSSVFKYSPKNNEADHECDGDADSDIKGDSDSSNKIEEEKGEVEVEDTFDENDAFKLRCYRCRGTIEGPKYSTCTCVEPAMTPEDVTNSKNARRGSIFQMMRRGSTT